MKFPVIVADCPWHFKTRSPKGRGRSADRHYPTMTIEDIKALPVADVAEDDCVLLLWVTEPLLPAALEVMAAWGFAYKTVAFTWAKTLRKSEGWHMGNGYWTRANPEMCLLGTRGRPRRQSKAVRELIVAPVSRHSQKTPEFYARVEQLLDGPYLELFAREEREGWTTIGNEVNDGLDIRTALPLLARSHPDNLGFVLRMAAWLQRFDAEVRRVAVTLALALEGVAREPTPEQDNTVELDTLEDVDVVPTPHGRTDATS